jgi:hypothetical protein
MPIRINLLAEDQAAEEMRRRDPARRLRWGAAILVGAVALWSVTLQFQMTRGNVRLAKLRKQWSAIEKDFNRVTDNLRKSAEVERKLSALQQLSTNRFLWGNALNALQQASIDDIQLTRLRSEQTYILTESTKPKTNSVGTVPAKPAGATEKITIRLEAKDLGAVPGQQVNKMKEAVANFPYFKQQLRQVDGVRLTELSPPQADPNDSTKTFVLFGLECNYPEKVRTK